MKVLVVMLIAAGIVWYFGFYSKDAIFHNSSMDSGSFLGRKSCPNLVPHNRYRAGSNESLGYEWARKNLDSNCPNEVSAYAQGCQEFFRQRQAFSDCANP
jgi:hypothetical protein